MNGDDTLRALTRFLDRCSVAGLATVSAAGVPHASNVVFACDPQAHLYFLSAAESCHADQIDRSGVAAVSVYAHDGPLTGVQARGPCRLLPADSPMRAAATEFYLAKLAELPGATLRRERAVAERLYCLRITWARLIDTTRAELPLVEWTRD